MLGRVRLRRTVPAICAVFITLVLTVVRRAGVSDVILGAAVGVLLGISIVSLITRRRLTS